MLGMRMAASSAKRTEETCKMFLAFALLLLASLLNVGVTAQDVVTGPPGTVEAEEQARGDNVVKTTAIPEPAHPEIPQIRVFPTLEKVTMPEQVTTAAVIKDAADTGDVGDAVDTGDNVDNGPAAPEEAADEGNQSTAQEHADVSKDEEPQTQAPMPSRGDGPINKPQPVPQDDVVCVSKDAVQHKNAVNLKLKASSNCEETKVKIGSVLQELCGEDCKLEIYQQDNSDEIIVSGKYVEDDVQGMANKFNNDNIKDKTDVMEAVPRWGKKSKLVLVTLLLAGLLLAALLIAGYYLMTHRKNSKGVRLAESFQVDEENQANTLVSVAPLPQEPVDKPIANGESPPENGTSSAPQTNGHSQTPVADTEM